MRISENSGIKKYNVPCVLIPEAVRQKGASSSWKATETELAEKAARNRLCVKLGALARKSIN